MELRVSPEILNVVKCEICFILSVRNRYVSDWTTEEMAVMT
jgi:hypothetical protein